MMNKAQNNNLCNKRGGRGVHKTTLSVRGVILAPSSEAHYLPLDDRIGDTPGRALLGVLA
jgi:hypothetical protein